jgi:hypothetical protein
MQAIQSTGKGEVANTLFTANVDFIDVQAQCMLAHDGREVKIKDLWKLSKTDQSSQDLQERHPAGPSLLHYELADELEVVWVR